MIKSMTGFASGKGAHGPYAWTWDIRSVNARGLDIRLRAPDWIDGLEAGLRAALAKALHRGSVTLSLRLVREEAGGGQSLNEGAVDAALNALAGIEARALTLGIDLAPSRAADILAMRGVMEQGAVDDDIGALAKAIMVDLPGLLADFSASRAREGAALDKVLAAQLDQIEQLTAEAAGLAEARKDKLAEALRANLARIMDNADGADPDRVAQELALIAVKADVTEEIDRLTAHVEAARALLASDGPVGRKLDFLTQEFNREANTLCSKAGAADLTSTGLALKAVIDQMREQVQNVE
jgi:uncharacterized protein (TIGR00255 family)